MTSVSVILFDLDDTLFAHTSAVIKGLAKHMQVSGCLKALEDPSAAYAIWHELEERHYSAHLRGEVGFQDQRRLRARDFAQNFGISIANDIEADAWFNGFLVEYRQAWALYEDVISTLDTLLTIIPGVRFGLITNGEKNISWEKINALDLGKRMEHIVISGEFGVTKPDRRIFEYACNLFSVEPGQVVYIGDRLETDAIGAQKAGLHGVWLNHLPACDSPSQEMMGISTISSISEITRLVESYKKVLR